MRFGVVGLGRMGANIARHAMEHGHDVVGYNLDADATKRLAAEGLDAAFSLEEMADKLGAPRLLLVYVPHGDATEAVCASLETLLSPDDLVADCGNSHWEDSKRRHSSFAKRGIRFLDVGTSGGIAGARSGACFMVGGDPQAFDVIAPLLRDLAIDDEAVVHAGEPGAGHFTKLVHNAIEFGMVQSIAEGVEMLQRSDYHVDLPAMFRNWNHGSVIRSWLVELMGKALSEADFGELSTCVEDTDEVKWVLRWALEHDIPTPAIAQAQTALMSYRDLDSPQAKAVALLRNGFGGHRVHMRAEDKLRRTG